MLKSKSQRIKILEYLAKHPGAHYSEIALRLKLKDYVVRGRLSEAAKAGLVYREAPGRYRLTGLGEYYVKTYVHIEKTVRKATETVERLVKDREKDRCLGKYYVIVNDLYQYKTIVFKREIDIVLFLKALKKFSDKYDFDISDFQVEKIMKCYEV